MYFGAKLTFYSSFVLTLLLCFIILNIVYPLNTITEGKADFSLLLYSLILIFSVIVFFLYIFERTFSDGRL